MDPTEGVFRFRTKRDYEDEMRRLLAVIGRDPENEELYDDLVEEYVLFCSVGVD